VRKEEGLTSRPGLSAAEEGVRAWARPGWASEAGLRPKRRGEGEQRPRKEKERGCAGGPCGASTGTATNEADRPAGFGLSGGKTDNQLGRKEKGGWTIMFPIFAKTNFKITFECKFNSTWNLISNQAIQKYAAAWMHTHCC